MQAAAVLLMNMSPLGRFPSTTPRRSSAGRSPLHAREWPRLRLPRGLCKGRFAVEFSSPEVDLGLLHCIATRDEGALAELYDRHSRLAYTLIPDELEALVLADSIGALDADERVAQQARLDALRPERRSEVARLYEAAAQIALSVPPVEPPVHVRDRLLAAVRKPSRYTVWAADAKWIDTGLPGIRARVLSVDQVRSLVTLVIRAEPGSVYPSHTPPPGRVFRDQRIGDHRRPRAARRRFPSR